MNANEDQPMPVVVTEASGAAVWDLVLADPRVPEWLRSIIVERDALGVSRYGQRLRVHNGRDALLDAFQEALDLWVYLKQCEMRALEVATDGSAAHQLRANGITFHVEQIFKTTLWLGALVQSKTELL